MRRRPCPGRALHRAGSLTPGPLLPAGILGLQKHFASQGAHSVYRAQLVDDDPLAPSLERAAGSAAGYAKQAVQGAGPRRPHTRPAVWDSRRPLSVAAGRAVSAMQEAAEAASAAGGVVVSEDAAQHLQGVLDGEDAFGLGEAAPMPHALFEVRRCPAGVRALLPGRWTPDSVCSCADHGPRQVWRGGGGHDVQRVSGGPQRR